MTAASLFSLYAAGPSLSSATVSGVVSLCVLWSFSKSAAGDAADADDDRAELGVVLLDLVHGLDHLGQVLVGLLGEDQDDGRAGLAVVLADVAKRVALLLAGDRLHVEGAADLLARARLQVLSANDGERQSNNNGQREQTDHDALLRYGHDRTRSGAASCTSETETTGTSSVRTRHGGAIRCQPSPGRQSSNPSRRFERAVYSRDVGGSGRWFWFMSRKGELNPNDFPYESHPSLFNQYPGNGAV